MEANLKNTCHVDRRVMRKAYAHALRSSTLAMLVAHEAHDILSERPALSTMSLKTYSAIGLRHMLP